MLKKINLLVLSFFILAPQLCHAASALRQSDLKLFEAIDKKDSESVKELVLAGANINAVLDGQTPLYRAVMLVDRDHRSLYTKELLQLEAIVEHLLKDPRLDLSLPANNLERLHALAAPKGVFLLDYKTANLIYRKMCAISHRS